MDNRTAKIGLMIFLATEIMFFAGLVSAYWVLRAQVVPWPPVGQPRLPVGDTAVNTIILLLSGACILLAERAVRRDQRGKLLGWLAATGIGGLIFLLVQGYEWVRLIRFGLRTAHNIYGGTFYIIIGAHALHLVVALAVLLIVLAKAVGGRYAASDYGGISLCRIYWLFVVAIWPVLYGIVYLA